jgi:predicted butyrate kinase (DUF1464 family)
VPRVIGIDPGTVTLDLCGLTDDRLTLDETWPTAEALANPERLVSWLTDQGPLDLIVGPSGYGLPLRRAADASEQDLRLAFLAAEDEPGGILGLRGFARRLAASNLPVVFIPGVIHLDTVPPHRKLNRIDLGTADKLCVAALAIHDRCERSGESPAEVSLILLELGGAFTAGLAIDRGRVVDGLGGTSGPIGWRAAGALDGEVAFLLGQVSKAALFQGGVTSVIEREPARRELAIDALVEGAERAVRRLKLSVPEAQDVVLSGRLATDSEIRQRLEVGLADIGPVRLLGGFASRARQGAQGAALIADGLAGGHQRAMVNRLGIREAQGTVLDYLYVIPPEAARRRLGLHAG